MLTEERKNQLDGIVEQMSGVGETDETIQFVVDDFKSKYISEPEQQPEGVGGVGGFALGFGKEFLGGSRGFAQTLQRGGQRFLGAITPGQTFEDIRQTTGLKSLKRDTEEGIGVEESLRPKGRAEKAGATAETIAEFAIPTGLALKTKLAKSAVKGGSKFIGEATLGTQEARAVSSGFTKPQLQRKVLSGEITTETIANKVGKFAKSIKQKGRKTLDVARGQIKGTSQRSTLSKELNNLFKKEKTERLLLGEETTLVNKLQRLVKKEIKRKGTIDKKDIDTLIKGIDDAGFFKTGAVADKFRNSNKIVNSVRQVLRKETIKGNTGFESLLKKASEKDIPFFEKLGKNVIGKDGQLNVDLLQNKINQLVRAIDDPNARQNSLKLLRELAKRGGAKADFVDELEVFARTRPLTGDIAGIASPLRTAQQLAGRQVARGARGLGTTFGKK